MTCTYEDACQRAGRAQGLAPALEALSRLFPGVHLEQTGGFCMVVEIPCPVGFVWVTLDGEDPDAPWVVGRYSSRDEDSTEEYTYASFSALPEVIAYHMRSES